MAGAPRTRYAKSGELNIAYQVAGAGPLDVVWTPGFISHLDLLWENDLWAHVTRRMQSFARVATFDKRGTGLSDREGFSMGVEERMDDIRAVMDAAGMERAALVGYSEGGPISILFAATYPERVSHLVLGSTFAEPLRTPELDDRLADVQRLWGSGHVLRFFGKDIDLEFAARYERASASPRVAAEILRVNAEIDVRDALGSITVPTLVIHRSGDPVVPVEAARSMAAAIAGARYVEHEAEGHEASTTEGWDHDVDLIEEFLTGEVRPVEPDRVLATVLFTDIVDSTGRAASMGDARWRDALRQLEHETQRVLKQFRGSFVKSTGDGVLATFDGPARAVRCAMALAQRADVLGLPIRAGLHTGEVELVGDDIAGIAVHLAKRVESSASAGTVRVSQTVKDLVTGSGIAFADCGEQELKGVPGSWRLYEVTGT